MSSQTDPSSQANASHPNATLHLQGLAPKVVANIVNHVDEQDSLRNLRLVSKSMNEHARRKMFEKVMLTPELGIDRWKHIADSESLSILPRHAIIQTRDDPDEDYAEDLAGDQMEEFGEALKALSKFPRLNSLELTFTNKCAGKDNDEWIHTDVTESIDGRVEIMQWVFQAIKDRMGVEGSSRIRSLTLRNLQNALIDEFTDSELFSTVMQQLDELHIGMIQEYNEHGPDHDYTCVELQTFPGHLCSKWLAPVAPNLRALSLYSAVDNWGCFPGYFDPSDISFPKLETLSLGYYTLTYDDQLDWLLQHKSITKLVMHNCMIAPLLRIDKENMRQWKTSTRDWEPIASQWGEADPSDIFRYRGTWSQFFDKIADGLPNLKEFCFDYIGIYGGCWGGGEKTPYGVQHRHDHSEAKAFPKRYLIFNNGILPTHWPEAGDDGQLETYFELSEELDIPNFHVEFLKKDKASLDKLLEKCRARREGGGI
ncbi:putative f-box domain containing protein [Rhypophila decipiens]